MRDTFNTTAGFDRNAFGNNTLDNSEVAAKVDDFYVKFYLTIGKLL